MHFLCCQNWLNIFLNGGKIFHSSTNCIQIIKVPSVLFILLFPFWSNVRNSWNLGNFEVVLQVSQLSKSVITKMQLIVSKQEIVNISKT